MLQQVHVKTSLVMNGKLGFQNRRYSLLAATAFLQGCGIGPLMNSVWQVNPAVILTAVLATAGVFMCFSLAALISPRRSYIFLGGKKTPWRYTSRSNSCAVLRLRDTHSIRDNGLR